MTASHKPCNKAKMTTSKRHTGGTGTSKRRGGTPSLDFARTQLQAALLLRQTFRGCGLPALPRVQVAAVGVLLALVRQAERSWDCAAMAISALSALEQGLWRLGADAGGHREAAQLLGR